MKSFECPCDWHTTQWTTHNAEMDGRKGRKQVTDIFLEPNLNLHVDDALLTHTRPRNETEGVGVYVQNGSGVACTYSIHAYKRIDFWLNWKLPKANVQLNDKTHNFLSSFSGLLHLWFDSWKLDVDVITLVDVRWQRPSAWRRSSVDLSENSLSVISDFVLKVCFALACHTFLRHSIAVCI